MLKIPQILEISIDFLSKYLGIWHILFIFICCILFYYYILRNLKHIWILNFKKSFKRMIRTREVPNQIRTKIHIYSNEAKIYNA